MLKPFTGLFAQSQERAQSLFAARQDGGGSTYMGLLTLLGRLRQLCCDPRLLPDELVARMAVRRLDININYNIFFPPIFPICLPLSRLYEVRGWSRFTCVFFQKNTVKYCKCCPNGLLPDELGGRITARRLCPQIVCRLNPHVLFYN